MHGRTRRLTRPAHRRQTSSQAFARTAVCVRGPRGLGRLAGPGRLGPPAGGCPEKEVIHWIVAVWLRWRWRPRRGTRTLVVSDELPHGNPAPPRPNVLGPGPKGPGPDSFGARSD